MPGPQFSEQQPRHVGKLRKQRASCWRRHLAVCRQWSVGSTFALRLLRRLLPRNHNLFEIRRLIRSSRLCWSQEEVGDSPLQRASTWRRHTPALWGRLLRLLHSPLGVRRCPCGRSEVVRNGVAQQSTSLAIRAAWNWAETMSLLGYVPFLTTSSLATTHTLPTSISITTSPDCVAAAAPAAALVGGGPGPRRAGAAAPAGALPVPVVQSGQRSQHCSTPLFTEAHIWWNAVAHTSQVWMLALGLEAWRQGTGGHGSATMR